MGCVPSVGKICIARWLDLRSLDDGAEVVRPAYVSHEGESDVTFEVYA